MKNIQGKVRYSSKVTIKVFRKDASLAGFLIGQILVVAQLYICHCAFSTQSLSTVNVACLHNNYCLHQAFPVSHCSSSENVYA